MEQYNILAIITILTSLLTFFLAFNVGGNRRKYHANVLKTTKEEHVLVANRVHMNTVENVVVFIPLMWIASIFGPTTIAGIVGIMWFVSRVVYAYAYMQNPKKREIPFLIGVICIAITALLAIYGVIM